MAILIYIIESQHIVENPIGVRTGHAVVAGFLSSHVLEAIFGCLTTENSCFLLHEESVRSNK